MSRKELLSPSESNAQSFRRALRQEGALLIEQLTNLRNEIAQTYGLHKNEIYNKLLFSYLIEQMTKESASDPNKDIRFTNNELWEVLVIDTLPEIQRTSLFQFLGITDEEINQEMNRMVVADNGSYMGAKRTLLGNPHDGEKIEPKTEQLRTFVQISYTAPTMEDVKHTGGGVYKPIKLTPHDFLFGVTLKKALESAQPVMSPV